MYFYLLCAPALVDWATFSAYIASRGLQAIGWAFILAICTLGIMLANRALARGANIHIDTKLELPRHIIIRHEKMWAAVVAVGAFGIVCLLSVIVFALLIDSPFTHLS